jgi:hypothetical protein
MPGRQCYHCKEWVEEGQPHDCWTTTESALTSDLSEDLRDAWERLRESAASLGDQRIYASHHSIMFARRACYCFVRPKRQYLELCIFLPRAVRAPQIRRVLPASRTRFANLIRIVHRDEVETPITDWIAEAYEFVNEVPRATKPGPTTATRTRARAKRPRAAGRPAAARAPGARRTVNKRR